MQVDFYDASLQEKIRSNLIQHGVCVINNVLDVNESQKMASDMAATLAYVSSDMAIPFDINNKDTYNTLREMLPTRGLIFQNFGLGQAQCCWDIRCNYKVIECFAKIYGTYDLLTSFDGFSFSVPPEMNAGRGFHKEQWFHFDQSTKRPNFECIQGWVTALDVENGDSTLVVMVGSHNLHNAYGETFGHNDGADWVQVKDNVKFFTDRGCFEYRIICPKGSLVLWDSRTLHYGSAPLQGRLKSNYRAIIYVCYTPRTLISESDRKRKIEIFMKRGNKGYKRTTSHWPHKPKMFPEVPRTYGNPIPKIRQLPDPIIDQKFMRMIGY